MCIATMLVLCFYVCCANSLRSELIGEWGYGICFSIILFQCVDPID